MIFLTIPLAIAFAFMCFCSAVNKVEFDKTRKIKNLILFFAWFAAATGCLSAALLISKSFSGVAA